MKVDEFVDLLSTELGVTQETAKQFYQGFVRAVCTAMSRGEEVSLPGFGKFVSKLQVAKQGRPTNESDLTQRVVEVTFVHFRSSRASLMRTCPFLEELDDGK